MSAELYELISLSARYLFILLGALIVLRAFFWLLTDHWERRRRLKSLPYAGMIGEFIVRTGKDIPVGTVIPVPWEGILGCLRSCDVIIPDSGVRNNHLSFFMEPGSGLVLHPFSGCEAYLNGQKIHCRTTENESIMKQDAVLQVGSVLLQLRLFSGLRPVENLPNAINAPALHPEVTSAGAEMSFSDARGESETSPSPSFIAESPVLQSTVFFPDALAPENSQMPIDSFSDPDKHLIYDTPSTDFSVNHPAGNLYPASDSIGADSESFPPAEIKKMRQRRSKRWEDDWSD